MRFLFPRALFRMESSDRSLCLTFDDGPDPLSTPEILGILRKYNVKVMFFCNGFKAENHPALMDRIISEGHLSGNHGYHHMNGWKTPAERYCNNVLRASERTSDRIFRPPYGKISLKQYRKLSKRFRLVFWDVMPYDFDRDFGPDKTLSVLMKKIRNGSIVVLHDKPGSSSLRILGSFIENALSKGYKFILPQPDQYILHPGFYNSD